MTPVLLKKRLIDPMEQAAEHPLNHARLLLLKIKRVTVLPNCKTDNIVFKVVEAGISSFET